MDPAEYSALARVEKEHWFYRGKRDIVTHWIGLLAGPRAGTETLLDVGAGTGQFVEETEGRFRVVACDAAPAALRLLGRRLPRVVGGRAEALPVRDRQAAVVTALDVLEHVEADRECLSELVRVARPGGLVVVTVPALPALWSAWDAALGHRRRYRRESLRALVDESRASVVRCAYINTAALLPMLVYRKLRGLFGPRAGSRMEDSIPWGPLNRLLHALYVRPACWRWFRAPVGAGLLLILRRKDPE